jgi:hypothetical protein
MALKSNTEYFAALASRDCVIELEHKAQTWGRNPITNSYLEKLRKSWAYYHGSFFKKGMDHDISFTGEQGELVQFPINDYRNIARHLLNMTTTNRPSLTARAANTDSKSLDQTILANGLLDYYMRERNLEDYLAKAAEYAVVFGEGYVRLGWNATAGEIFEEDEENGEKFYEGDLEFTNVSPLDVVRDSSKEDYNEHEYLIVRSFKNRYALMAKYPELKEELANLQSKDDLDKIKYPLYGSDKTDDIPIYEFFHKKNDALPEGRYVIYASPDAIFYDGPLPYREIPVYRMSAADILGTPYGYTMMFDLMPLQEAQNMLYSTIMTNQNAFGVQNVLIPKGADLNLSQLTGGLNIIEYNALQGFKPEALNLTQTPAEIFKMAQLIEQKMETLSGINSVTRGNPEASLKSGAALALVQAQAVQFSSSLQQSYVRLMEHVGTAMIRILQDYAKYPRVAAIVGKSNRTYMKEFSSKDLTDIKRVVVEVSNALSKTTAGRLEIANQLLQMQVITNPKDYFTVLNTGNLDIMTEGSEKELIYIKSENEEMMEGRACQAVAFDNHSLHVDEHKSLLADPELRRNAALVTVVLDHIQEHIDLLSGKADPRILQITNQQPLQPPPPPPGEQPPPGPQGPDQGQGGPAPGPQSNPGNALQQQPPTGAEAAQQQAMPEMPKPPGQFANMPTNPADVMPGGNTNIGQQ